MAGNQNEARSAVAAAVATPTPAGRTLRDELLERKGFLEATLPRTVDAERFIRMVLTTVRLNPGLQECSPMSIVTGAVLSALYGLEIGPMGHAYLVPFRNNRTNTKEAQFILGYKGMIDLARRSGELGLIEAREVHEHDEFDFAFGLEPRLTHTPTLGDRGEIVAFYGVARLRNGEVLSHVMSKREVDAYRARSRAKDNGPWVTDYAPMGCKTVIRRMWRWLPQSVEAKEVMQLDERVIPSFELPAGTPADEIVARVVEANEVDPDAGVNGNGNHTDERDAS